MSAAPRLAGKVAVITGAGGGLGRSLAVAFAEEGAAVVCHDLLEGAARETADAVAAVGGVEPLPWVCDVTDSAAIEAMFAAAAERFGVVDVLVNNAGVNTTLGDGSPDAGGLDQLLAMSDEGWRSMFDIHVAGAFYCSRALVRGLITAGQAGSVICISSVVALTGYGPIHYAAAKAALIGFVRSLAVFGGPHGIRANAVCPGMIKSPMSDLVPEAQEWVRRRTPLGRIGLPEDLAPLLVYLAGDESSFVTGQTISASGGFVLS